MEERGGEREERLQPAVDRRRRESSRGAEEPADSRQLLTASGSGSAAAVGSLLSLPVPSLLLPSGGMAFPLASAGPALQRPPEGAATWSDWARTNKSTQRSRFSLSLSPSASPLFFSSLLRSYRRRIPFAGDLAWRWRLRAQTARGAAARRRPSGRCLDTLARPLRCLFLLSLLRRLRLRLADGSPAAAYSAPAGAAGLGRSRALRKASGAQRVLLGYPPLFPLAGGWPCLSLTGQIAACLGGRRGGWASAPVIDNKDKKGQTETQRREGTGGAEGEERLSGKR